MITIRKSHSLYTLVSLLGDALKEKRPAHPLRPQTIIVPNLDTSRWLKLELAERLGIAANLECILPAEWQYRQIRKLYPDLPKKLPSDILPMTWSIYNILIDENHRAPYERIKHYIGRQAGANVENATWQLAGQIASVFDAYIVYRPELLLDWQAERIGKQADKQWQSDEEWQAKLWTQLNQQWKTLPDKSMHKNRAELYRDLLQSVESNGSQGSQSDSPLFVFNPGLIPKPILNVLKECGSHTDLLIYRSTPSSRVDDATEPAINPLLASLGHESEELDAIFEEVFGDSGTFIKFEEEIHAPKSGVKSVEARSLLRQIQKSIIENKPVDYDVFTGDAYANVSGDVPSGDSGDAPANGSADGSGNVPSKNSGNVPAYDAYDTSADKSGDALSDGSSGSQTDDSYDASAHNSGDTPADASIRIHSCHSPLREVETLHQSLLELFESDPSLHPDDVLVTTPDPEAYEPFIRAVFGTVEEGLPEIPWHMSLPMKRDNSPERTFTQWLHLPDSRFHFQQVMDLFTMRPVWEKAGLDESDVENIKQWMEENSVIWGLDQTHRGEVGQPATDYQTWESALKRGWYGQWMADKPGIMKNDTLLYTGIHSSSQMETWSAFSAFMHGLDRFRNEIKQPRPAIEWCDQIRFRFEQLVGSDLMGTPNGATINKTIDAILESAALIADNRKIPFSLIRNVITSKLDQSGSSGAVFTRGVTFSSMVPVRSIPFRVIALIGLNESSFPRKQSAIDFDLMAQKPKPGERNRKYEDRNLFLESILAAQELHYVSYIGQSPVDNDEIPPSTIVNEWMDEVAGSSGRKIDDVVRKESLHSFSEQNFKNGKSYSKTAFQTAVALNQNDNKSSGLSWSEPLADEGEAPKWITVSDLTRFYRNPIRAFVTDQMGAWLQDPEDEKDEFSSGYLEKYILFQQLFGWKLNGMEESEMYSLVRQSGQLPDGIAGERVFKEKMGQCKTALRILNEKKMQPVSARLQIDVFVDEVRIQDVISTNLEGELLDISPSSLSGALLIQTWIRHLAWNLSNRSELKSHLLCEIKDSGPKWVTFNSVKSPEKYLSPLLEQYQIGRREPLLFFPKTIYTFEDADRSSKTNDPVELAATEFEGGDWKMGERMNINVKALLGPDASFKPDYVEEPFRSLISTMMDHMEVDK